MNWRTLKEFVIITRMLPVQEFSISGGGLCRLFALLEHIIQGGKQFVEVSQGVPTGILEKRLALQFGEGPNFAAGDTAKNRLVRLLVQLLGGKHGREALRPARIKIVALGFDEQDIRLIENPA